MSRMNGEGFLRDVDSRSGGLETWRMREDSKGGSVRRGRRVVRGAKRRKAIGGLKILAYLGRWVPTFELD